MSEPPPPAVAARWYLGYFMFVFLPIAVLFGSLTWVLYLTMGRSLQPWLTASAILIGVAASTGVFMTLVFFFDLRGRVRQGLARWAGSEPARVLGVAYRQVDGRWKRRPPGVLIATDAHLWFVAARDKDAQHDVSWLLKDITAVAQTPDRFGIVSRVLDLQGAIELEAEPAGTFSVVGCHRFTELFTPVWARATRASRLTRPKQA